MGVYGAYKGAKELHDLGRVRRLPRLLCVQQESCAPMARAFSREAKSVRKEFLVAKPTGIAEAILRGDPRRAYPRVRRIVMESGGGFAVVSEAEFESRGLVEISEGISPCFSASAAVAGLIQLVRKDAFPRNACIVVNLTGGDRPVTEECPEVNGLIGLQTAGLHHRPQILLHRLQLARAIAS